MGQDLRCVGVLLLRDVADLLEQGQIDIGLDVAHRARIAVPVPGAAEVAALFDHPDVANPGLPQTRARQQPSKAAADHHHVDVVRQRRPRESGLHVGVVDVARELAFDLQILLVAVAADALVPLPTVLRTQRVRIESECLRTRGV
jgi:hypothetical protein